MAAASAKPVGEGRRSANPSSQEPAHSPRDQTEVRHEAEAQIMVPSTCAYSPVHAHADFVTIKCRVTLPYSSPHCG